MYNIFKKFFFIVGCPRSGTTLLQSLFLNIENSYSMPETHFFDLLPNNNYVAPRSLSPFFKFKYPKTVLPHTLNRVISSMRRHSQLFIDISDLDELQKKAKNRELDICELFNKLTSLYNKENKEIFIEKTPTHVFHLPYIQSLFPEAVIINIVRDPRDVFISFNGLVEKHGKKKRTVREFCLLWNYALHCAVEFGVTSVRYEDLVQNPLEKINEIIKPSGLFISELNKDNYKQIIKPGEVWHKNLSKEVISDNFGKYKKLLSKKEIAEIEILCKDGMKMFGYNKFEGSKYNFLFSTKDALFWQIRKVVVLLVILKNWFKRKVGDFLINKSLFHE